MTGSQFNAVVVGGVIVLVVALVVANALWNPKARARRAEARRKRREMAELRSRVAANARATYNKQFPHGKRSRSGSTSYDGGTIIHTDADSSGRSGRDSGGDSGGGDAGGGGGDGG